jgi:hypothetical protein
VRAGCHSAIPQVIKCLLSITNDKWSKPLKQFSFQVPQVRDFIYGSLTADYERTEFRKVFDKPPTAVFYDEGGNVLEEVLLRK